MSRLAAVLALLLSCLAAAAAALIVLPAPSLTLALVAIAVGEKSFFIIAGAVAGAVLALFASGPGTRLVATLAVLMSLAAIVLALIPLAQALRVASEQRVELDFERYLRAKVDTEGSSAPPGEQSPARPTKTVTYATVEGRPLHLDVYAPALAGGPGEGDRAAASPSPSPSPSPSARRGIVVVHGGGWSAGDKGDASLASRWLADQGFTVFDVEYRTAPQPNWRTAIGDLKCAIGWVKGHASTPEWNVDPGRLTLLGRSAGGHLALMAAYAPADPLLPPSCEVAPGGTADLSVNSVVAFYAPTDLVWGYAHPARRRVYDSSGKLRQFIGGPPEATDGLYAALSPTERVTSASPRTLLIHGGRDQLIGRQHVDLLAEKLHAAGVRYETLIIPYAQHGFDFIFGGLSGQIAEAVMLRFLDAEPPQRTAPAPGVEGATPAPDGGDAVPNSDGGESSTIAPTR